MCIGGGDDDGGEWCMTNLQKKKKKAALWCGLAKKTLVTCMLIVFLSFSSLVHHHIIAILSGIVFVVGTIIQLEVIQQLIQLNLGEVFILIVRLAILSHSIIVLLLGLIGY